MPIFKLTPISSNEMAWRTSTYRQIVIVRADTEAHARGMVRQSTQVAVWREPEQEWPISPWERESIVSCEEITDEAYPEEGDMGILDNIDMEEPDEN